MPLSGECDRSLSEQTARSRALRRTETQRMRLEAEKQIIRTRK